MSSERVDNVDARFKGRVELNVGANSKARGEEAVRVERDRGAKDAVDAGVGGVAEDHKDAGAWRGSTDKVGAKISLVRKGRARS